MKLIQLVAACSNMLCDEFCSNKERLSVGWAPQQDASVSLIITHLYIVSALP